MRIPIREQIGALILLSSLIGLAVVSVATWISNHIFVINIASSRMSLTASLKAAQLASNLNLMQTSANFVSNRIVIQNALERYNNQNNNTRENWVNAVTDMQDAISGGGSVGQQLLLQSMIFPRNTNGSAGTASLLNTTSSNIDGTVRLPYDCPDTHTPVYLGNGQCSNLGYPPNLYPNLTYIQSYYNSTYPTTNVSYMNDPLAASSALLIGPWIVNAFTSLVSLTVPVVNNTSAADVLAWLTVVMNSTLITSVVDSTAGLTSTAQILLVGPDATSNILPPGILNNPNASGDFPVRFVLPINNSIEYRHPGRNSTYNPAFNASQFPAVLKALTQSDGQPDNAGAILRTKNEAGQKVSVGYAIPQQNLVQWVVLVEKLQSDVWAPIKTLRDILIACVFSTAVILPLIAFPLAHLAAAPIRRLREATRQSIEPPGMTPSRSSFDTLHGPLDGQEEGDAVQDPGAAHVDATLARKEGMPWNPVTRWRQQRREEAERRQEARRRRAFRIPGKVKERRSCIKDELTDLTRTFNEMSDELMMQYERLEERVQQRTAELELSKKAAEAANESKTLFIANISHELKTPLNGILGMCAVCMQEDDPVRLKRSLGIIYKSGDLLLNLLTDLLTFSKNQVGQQLSLDEKEFRLRDVSSQLLAIFDKQAKEGHIDLRVRYEGVQGLEQDGSSPEREEYGPAGTGKLKNMIFWGDIHRILQVVINLVSNALKFTPAGGSVVVTIRCLEELPEMNSRKGSTNSRQSRQRSSRRRSDISLPMGSGASPKDRVLAAAQERAPSPPPGRYLNVEFEVADTGPGIVEHLQQKIFEPFVQGDLGLSKKYGGTGLGLSICSQLASLMRGTIGVESELGRGSTFTMRIPIRHIASRADSTSSSFDAGQDASRLRRSQSEEEGTRTPDRRVRHHHADHDDLRISAIENGHGSGGPPTPTLSNDSQPRLIGLSAPFFAASQPLESPNSQGAAMEKIKQDAKSSGKIRVLVAEDNKVNQEVVLRMLKLEDIYDVTVAKDGQEALDRVRESMDTPNGQPFNLIFMDVQMPNVDGLTSTRLIREIGYQAPIVALTAFAEESNIKDCYDSGMNYFLSKPIRRPQLKKVLKEYCAPIPEENEEVTTPPPTVDSVAGDAVPKNTIVVLNAVSPSDAYANHTGMNGDVSMARKSDAAPTDPRNDAPVEERAVSPLSMP